MHIGLLYVHLSIPGAQSLKDRRRVVRSIKDRLKALNVAVAEVGDRAHWQTAELAVVAVANDQGGLDQLLGSAERIVNGNSEAVVVETTVEQR